MLGTKTTMSTSRSKWFLKWNQLVHVSIGIPPRGHDRTKRIRKERYKRMVGLTTVFEKKAVKFYFRFLKISLHLYVTEVTAITDLYLKTIWL